MSKRKLFYAAQAAQKRANPCSVRVLKPFAFEHGRCRFARSRRKRLIEDVILVGLLQLHTAFSRIPG